jgi:hypothetical protein
MKLTLMPKGHPAEETFEQYAFRRLPEKDVSDLEEHVLICEECQCTLAETWEYVQLMKVATAARAPQFRRRGLWWNAAAAALLLLTCLSALLSWKKPSSEPATVVLVAYRGAVSEASAGRPLDLQIDLEDAPPAAACRVEVVDSSGNRMWFGGMPARLTNGLPAGMYWVRLATDRGELLREYGLKVGHSR